MREYQLYQYLSVSQCCKEIQISKAVIRRDNICGPSRLQSKTLQKLLSRPRIIVTQLDFILDALRCLAIKILKYSPEEKKSVYNIYVGSKRGQEKTKIIGHGTLELFLDKLFFPSVL